MLGSVSSGCDSCLLCSMLAPARFTFGLVDSGAVRFGFELGLSRLVFDAFQFGLDMNSIQFHPGSVRAQCLDGLGLVFPCSLNARSFLTACGLAAPNAN